MLKGSKQLWEISAQVNKWGYITSLFEKYSRAMKGWWTRENFSFHFHFIFFLTVKAECVHKQKWRCHREGDIYRNHQAREWPIVKWSFLRSQESVGKEKMVEEHLWTSATVSRRETDTISREQEAEEKRQVKMERRWGQGSCSPWA